MLAIVRELATAIDPVPLEEVRQREIEVFLRDNRPRFPARTFRRRDARTRMEKFKAELHFAEYDGAMTCFREFLRKTREGRKGR